MINIVGAGLAGLSAALAIAKENRKCRLISNFPPCRAQSVLAEGGINAALDLMGENDSIEEHFNDTYKGGCFLADSEAVRGLVSAAPGIIGELVSLGMPFYMEKGDIKQRAFGGQGKRRTLYAKSSTGKALMNTLIDEIRKYEIKGLIESHHNHDFCGIKRDKGKCAGVYSYDKYRGEKLFFPGAVIMAAGGFTGFLGRIATGSRFNTGDAAALLFNEGVIFSNLEMIQYHPTSIVAADKRILISEAARGEGGRLFTEDDNGKRLYFMEEKYPELKNLMPRDIVSREVYFNIHDRGKKVWLDMGGIRKEIWDKGLSDLRDEIRQYTGLDPAREPIEVMPAVHYFMGGIKTDKDHRTNLHLLYAAGECACQYHGANRIGGNSLLGAIYGGKRAAASALSDYSASESKADRAFETDIENIIALGEDKKADDALSEILIDSMGIARDEKCLSEGLNRINSLRREYSGGRNELRFSFAEAMIKSALSRKESRGAHYRTDFPETRKEYGKATEAFFDGREAVISI